MQKSVMGYLTTDVVFGGEKQRLFLHLFGPVDAGKKGELD